jgi:hypothetical protein
VPKRIVWAMLKKEKRRKISMPKGMRGKKCMPKIMKKRKEKKRRKK